MYKISKRSTYCTLPCAYYRKYQHKHAQRSTLFELNPERNVTEKGAFIYCTEQQFCMAFKHDGNYFSSSVRVLGSKLNELIYTSQLGASDKESLSSPLPLTSR
jgi:hypothetical protein